MVHFLYSNVRHQPFVCLVIITLPRGTLDTGMFINQKNLLNKNMLNHIMYSISPYPLVTLLTLATTIASLHQLLFYIGLTTPLISHTHHLCHTKPHQPYPPLGTPITSVTPNHISPTHHSRYTHYIVTPNHISPTHHSRHTHHLYYTSHQISPNTSVKPFHQPQWSHKPQPHHHSHSQLHQLVPVTPATAITSVSPFTLASLISHSHTHHTSSHHITHHLPHPSHITLATPITSAPPIMDVTGSVLV